MPKTTDPAAIAKFAQFGLTPGQNFPNNIIPTGLLNANATALLKAGLFPGPNTASGRYYTVTNSRPITARRPSGSITRSGANWP